MLKQASIRNELLHVQQVPQVRLKLWAVQQHSLPPNFLDNSDSIPLSGTVVSTYGLAKEPLPRGKRIVRPSNDRPLFNSESRIPAPLPGFLATTARSSSSLRLFHLSVPQSLTYPFKIILQATWQWGSLKNYIKTPTWADLAGATKSLNIWSPLWSLYAPHVRHTNTRSRLRTPKAPYFPTASPSFLPTN